MLRKGISPVIATVILVAVALILAVALAGWVMGLWGTLGSTEALQVVSASLTNATTNNLNVIVVNKGTTTAKVILITLSNATWSETALCTPSEIEIRAGNYTTITCTVGAAGTVSRIVPGNIYTVRVTTLSGTYTYDVRAIQA
ncbi:MAG: hypothetical protein N3G48_05490 [Sulfolobales archaeon]|nr:hypothetical protein [Sulfolobales archaeon]